VHSLPFQAHDTALVSVIILGTVGDGCATMYLPYGAEYKEYLIVAQNPTRG